MVRLPALFRDVPRRSNWWTNRIALPSYEGFDRRLGRQPDPHGMVWKKRLGFSEYGGIARQSGSEVSRLFTRRFPVGQEMAARHRWCEERGIRYVVVVCPDKHSIYPEYLDDVHQRHPPPKPLPLLFSKLSGTNVRVVDLTPPLLAAKPVNEEPLYFRLDTHWNPHGNLVGYREVAGAVAEKVIGFPVRLPVGSAGHPA